MGTYDDIFRASVADPERFWLDAADAIDWTVRTDARRWTRRGRRSTGGSPTAS